MCTNRGTKSYVVVAIANNIFISGLCECNRHIHPIAKVPEHFRKRVEPKGTETGWPRPIAGIDFNSTDILVSATLSFYLKF